jgi:hypothetical protein
MFRELNILFSQKEEQGTITPLIEKERAVTGYA